MRRGRTLAGSALALVAASGCDGAGASAAPAAPSVVRLRPTAPAPLAAAERLAPLVEACWGLPTMVDAVEPWPAGSAEGGPRRSASRREDAGVTPEAALSGGGERSGPPPAGDEGGPRDARALLAALAPRRPADAAALVWIGAEPLREAADPASRAVFGLGEAHERLAVVSLAHLGAEGEAAPWAARRARVVLHETGHALGLAHCDDPWCLMHDCDDTAELDATGLAPCATCWRRYAGVRGHSTEALRAALVAVAAGLGLAVAPPEAHERDPDRGPGGVPRPEPPWGGRAR